MVFFVDWLIDWLICRFLMGNQNKILNKTLACFFFVSRHSTERDELTRRQQEELRNFFAQNGIRHPASTHPPPEERKHSLLLNGDLHHSANDSGLTNGYVSEDTSRDANVGRSSSLRSPRRTARRKPLHRKRVATISLVPHLHQHTRQKKTSPEHHHALGGKNSWKHFPPPFSIVIFSAFSPFFLSRPCAEWTKSSSFSSSPAPFLLSFFCAQLLLKLLREQQPSSVNTWMVKASDGKGGGMYSSCPDAPVGHTQRATHSGPQLFQPSFFSFFFCFKIIYCFFFSLLVILSLSLSLSLSLFCCFISIFWLIGRFFFGSCAFVQRPPPPSMSFFLSLSWLSARSGVDDV